MRKSTRFSGYRIFEIIAFSKEDEICVFISAHTKPQLHRFSLGRFAARIREISPTKHIDLPAPSHPHPRPILDLQLVTHDYTARYIGGMHRARSTPVILSRLLAFCRRIRDCAHTHKHMSSRFFIPLGHVYPREENVRRKENVSPRCRQILSRARRSRNGSYTMAEKRGTKYLICGRTKLARRMKCTFHFVHEHSYYHDDEPSSMEDI